jgi:hypothetical protein
MNKEEAFTQAIDIMSNTEGLSGPTAEQLRLLDNIAKAIFEAHNTGYRAGYLDSENGAEPTVTMNLK